MTEPKKPLRAWRLTRKWQRYANKRETELVRDSMPRTTARRVARKEAFARSVVERHLDYGAALDARMYVKLDAQGEPSIYMGGRMEDLPEHLHEAAANICSEAFVAELLNLH